MAKKTIEQLMQEVSALQAGLLASSVLGLAFSLTRLRERKRARAALEGLGRVKSRRRKPTKRLHKYVDPCMKRYGNKEYCWRVAWNIYCSHVDPKYPGCTKYGRKWGKPYSRPLSRKSRVQKRRKR
jgi:hypothetical protein